MAGCNFVLAHTNYTSKNVTEIFDLGRNVGSTHTRCLLRQNAEFFFPPSDLYQVQDHGWVIWLMEAFLLQSSVCTGNDRPVLQHLLTGFYPLSFVSYS